MDDDPIYDAIARARRDTKAANGAAEQLEMELVRFKGEKREIQLNLDLSGETVWATQQQIADLFGIASNTVTEHIKNVFRDGELDELAVARRFRATGPDGKSYNYLHYNLDLIRLTHQSGRGQTGPAAACREEVLAQSLLALDNLFEAPLERGVRAHHLPEGENRYQHGERRQRDDGVVEPQAKGQPILDL